MSFHKKKHFYLWVKWSNMKELPMISHKIHMTNCNNNILYSLPQTEHLERYILIEVVGNIGGHKYTQIIKYINVCGGTQNIWIFGEVRITWFGLKYGWQQMCSFLNDQIFQYFETYISIFWEIHETFKHLEKYTLLPFFDWSNIWMFEEEHKTFEYLFFCEW